MIFYTLDKFLKGGGRDPLVENIKVDGVEMF